jgi:hypothetical protein
MWIFVAVGAMTFLFLQLHFSLAWNSYYSNFPWLGYGTAMEKGNVPAFFSTSPRSMLIACIVLFALPLFALWFAEGRPWKAARSIWVGVMLSVILIWLTTKQMREDSNMWPIDLVYLSIVTALPIFLGAFIMRVIQDVTAYIRRLT